MILRTRASLTLLVAAACGLILLLLWPRQALLQGWLIAFVLWSGVPIGALVLILIDALTGGRWGDALGPRLHAVAAMLPLACVAFLPIAFNLSATYPWAADPASAPAGVARFYLNPAGFLVRATIALGGWSILAVLVSATMPRLAAGLALASYGLIISLVAVDWILSVELRYPSSSFAAGVAVQQILSALAFIALIGPDRRGPTRLRDLAGLILAALLGLVYLDLMAYIVAWYGNLPDKAAWYVRRSEGGWQFVILAATLIGALAPLVLLMSERRRGSAATLRVVGALVLIGVALHTLWLLAPVFAPAAIPAAALALVALTGFSFAFAELLRVRREPALHAQ